LLVFGHFTPGDGAHDALNDLLAARLPQAEKYKPVVVALASTPEPPKEGLCPMRELTGTTSHEKYSVLLLSSGISLIDRKRHSQMDCSISAAVPVIVKHSA